MPATALLTSEQFSALPDSFDENGTRLRQELISGELVEMPPAFELHNIVKGNIAKALIGDVFANPDLGFTVWIEMAYAVTDYDTYVPDVSFVRTSRLNPKTHKYIPGAPEIAIEVVSPFDKAIHLKSKVDAYLQNGSKTVWVVFPDTRSVMLYTSDSVRELKADQNIEDALLPGFSSPVSAFFELI